MTDAAMQLTTLLSGIQNIEAAIARNPEVDHVLDALPDYSEPRITNQLVGLAAVMRNYLFERDPSSVEQSEWLSVKDRPVGLWLEAEEERPLGLKDACDKLVHHRSIAYPILDTDTMATDSIYATKQKLSIMDCAIIRGERPGRDRTVQTWTALVNLYWFAAAAYFTAELLE